MLKLYGHVNRLSANTLKLRVALAEAGAAYEYIPIDLSKGEQRKPEFVALNPHSKVPVLVDGDFRLPESDAIMWYIAETHPAAKLLGSTAQDRARALQWCDFGTTALYPAYFDLYLHTVSNPPEQRLAPVAEAGRSKLERALKVLEQTLGERQWLAGAYSIADIGNASVLRAAQDRVKLDLAAWPHIQGWYGRVTARPAWQAAIAAG